MLPKGGFFKELDEDDIITFGKYESETVMEVLEKDPGYLVWAEQNIAWFKLKDYILNRAEDDAAESL